MRANGLLYSAVVVMGSGCLTTARGDGPTQSAAEALPKAVAAVASPLNALGLPEKALSAKGALVIAGGGRMPEDVYTEFIKLAGGQKARLVIVPSAYAFASLEAARQRYSGWRDYHTATLDYVHAQSREQADSDQFLAPLRQATGVWFTGGYQSRLAGLYGNTKAETALKSVLERGGVVGGTSAGAAAMSGTMIRWGRTEANLDRGLSLAQKSIIDMHFTQRNREGRLLGALARHPDQIGLGVDEGTALIVQGSQLRVVGRSKVAVYLPQSDPAKPAVHRLDPGDAAEFAISTPVARQGQTTAVTKSSLGLRRLTQ